MKKAPNNEEIVIKQEQKHNFIIVYDTIYKNTELTAVELGLLIKLLSIAPTFKPTKNKLITLLHIGEKPLLKATKGLQEKGYLKITKDGRTSQWTITQEPIKDLKSFDENTLLNALINYEITLNDLKQLHRLKYIDDNMLIKVSKEYAKQIQKLVKAKWWEQ